MGLKNMTDAYDFAAIVHELAARPIGYTVCLPDSGMILRANWRDVEDIWIGQDVATSEMGDAGAIVIYESEEMAKEAAAEVGGLAVEVVARSAGQA